MTFGILAMHYIVVAWICLNTPKLNFNIYANLSAFFLTFAFISGMYLTRVYDGTFAGVLRSIIYIWLGALFLSFALVMAAMSAQFIMTAFKIRPPFALGPLVAAAALIISLYSVINAYRTPLLIDVKITNPKAPRKLVIAQITDTHLGDGVSPMRLQKLFEKLALAKPDLVVFTGDIFERGGRHTRQYIDIIKNFSPRCGKYAVSGNHEYYGGLQRNFEYWRQAGITPLLNGSSVSCDVNIVGVNDIKSSRLSAREFEDIIKRSDTDKFTLLLSHTPLYYEQAADAGADLMLSGHTHNGQLWPFNLLVRTQFKHVHGAYKAAGGDFVHYVSAGAFYWGPPMRFLTYNEVPVFRIEP
jgi:predicted MPP superfamily phosphohydrolase